MNFRFDINALFKNSITKVTNTLIPEGFQGNRSNYNDVISKVKVILDEMGHASAVAQGLQKVITNSELLRHSDHVVYVLTDPSGNGGHGSVVGILKIGHKNLFVFDAAGAQHEVQPLCVLDFYIHESKQRMGCGKILYNHMLKIENLRPEHLAIDKPSDKFLAFLFKHYGLKTNLPQINNFVIFEGFFEGRPGLVNRRRSFEPSPNRMNPAYNVNMVDMSNGDIKQPIFGRHAAQKPQSVMGKVLQNNYNSPKGSVNYEDDDDDINRSNGHQTGDQLKRSDSPVDSLSSDHRSDVSSCGYENDSCPAKRDLKFHHSPLW